MQIDINADLGEGGAFDRELLLLVSSANISCGAHAGDTNSITCAIRLAVEHRVRIGAHPSYPDRENFGRLPMQLPYANLRQHLLSQLETLHTLISKQNATLAHIKPHGALYNQLAKDPKLADQFTEIVQEFDPTLPVVGLAGGIFLHVAQQKGLRTYSEVFADRRYKKDGTLVPRSNAQAVIEDSDEAVAQCLEIVKHHHVRSIDEHLVPVQADTLCVHGDSAIALTLAQKLHHRFAQEGIRIAAFTKDR